MKKIPRSERINKEIEDIFYNGTTENEDLLNILIRKSLQKLIQEVTEQKVQDYLGRAIGWRDAPTFASGGWATDPVSLTFASS